MKRLVLFLVTILIGFGIFAGGGMAVQAARAVNDREAAEAAALERLKEQGAAIGVYSVGISYEVNGELVEETVLLMIEGPHTVVNELTMIDASDVTVSLDQIARLTDQDWIKLANAKAWRLADQVPITVSGVNSSQVKMNTGEYPLYFAAEGGVQTQVMVTVTEAAEATIINSFSENQLAGYSEAYTADGELFGSGFTGVMIFFSELFLFLLFLIPLAVLIIQYFATGKIVKQIIYIITK